MAQLYFYYSAMNAGKSTSLLQSAHNYREQGMRVAVFTAAIDDRFGRATVSSRIGLSAEAELYDADTDFLDVLAGRLGDAKERSSPDGAARGGGGDGQGGGSGEDDDRRLACVLVDEAQFLTPGQVDQLARLVDGHGVPVCSASACARIFAASCFRAPPVCSRSATSSRSSRRSATAGGRRR